VTALLSSLPFVRSSRRSAAAGSVLAPQALVLGGTEAVALGAALAGELRAQGRAPTALIAIWAPEGMEAGPLTATPAARALVARLERRGFEAVARGRLVWLAPAGVAGDAFATAVRASRAVDVPFVLVVSGPRPVQADRIIGEFDLVVVAQPEDDCGAAALAVADLDGAGVGAVACRPPVDLRKAVALAGWGRLRGEGGEIGELAAALA
jgi:hypothetical protein